MNCIFCHSASPLKVIFVREKLRVICSECELDLQIRYVDALDSEQGLVENERP